MNLAQAHLIGHSLGAQLMGSVCRNLDLQHKIGRLTGLDPVEPMFNIFDELKPSDADLVINIHTSTILETLRKNSDIDFIPNGRSGTQLDPLLPCELYKKNNDWVLRCTFLGFDV